MQDESSGGQRHPQQTQQHDLATVVGVGQPAGGQGEQNGGNHLYKPHQPEGEWLAGALVDIPADSDGLHTRPQARENAANCVATKGGDAKWRVRIVRDTRRGLVAQAGSPDVVRARSNS